MKRSDFKVGIVGAGWIAAKAAETLNGLEGFYIMELMDGLRREWDVRYPMDNIEWK